MYCLKTYPNQDFLLYPSRSEGSFIYDGSNNKYLDLTAGGTSFNLLGSGNKKVHDAISNQLKKFEHLDCKTFFDENRERLSIKLLQGTNRGLENTHRVFFSGSSGSEAIEMAMHLSYQYHCESGNASKTWFLSRNQSYHGATSGALSVGERPNLEFYRPLQSSMRARLSECNYSKNKHAGETEEQYTAMPLEEFETCIISIGPENICAFIGETMLGGLVRDVPTKSYWRGMSSICKKYNIHLILDEVWCGTGSSGRYHCFEYDDVIPDFLCLGKSLGCGYIPISAVLVPAAFEHIKSGRVEMSCTFQAHSLAVASALAVQSIILEPGFISQVNSKGQYIRKVLHDQLSVHDFVKDIRGRGIRNSIEFSCNDTDKFSQTIGRLLFENHRIICSSKWHRTSFCHAMNLELETINFYLDKFLDVFKSTAKNWSASSSINLSRKHSF